MKEIFFEIPGEPQGKARPKTVRLKNGMSSTYTPGQTATYENMVRICFQDAVGPGFEPMKGQLRVHVTAFYMPPANKPKKWFELAMLKAIRPIKKPDWDNIGKIVCDALNGIAFKDDSMVVDGRVCKYFANRPRVEVIISDITDVMDTWSRK